MVMVHGRGASAEDMLLFVDHLAHMGFAYLAPQAADHSWYPHSFLAPLTDNEPGISSGFALLTRTLAQITDAGIPLERTILLGFSQGACLTLEYAARHAQRYGGVVGWSGGLIGPDDTPRDYTGSLAGVPIFLGCSDVDPHVPLARVDLSAEVLRRLGGVVTKHIYPKMAHTVNREEIAFAKAMMAPLLSREDPPSPFLTPR
ncbi:MAG TPA: phospholipase [Ktedonobacterales bacterium]|nr:phospholipase [Ktedonobacterales bacterium]